MTTPTPSRLSLRAELGRLFRIEAERAEYCAECGLPRDNPQRIGRSALEFADCDLRHENRMGGDLAEPHPDRQSCRILALYYSACTPDEIREFLLARGFADFAEHVGLLCRSAGPIHETLRAYADRLERGDMLGGAWMFGWWMDQQAVAALRWAAERIEAHPFKPVGYDGSNLPNQPRESWAGKPRRRR